MPEGNATSTQTYETSLSDSDFASLRRIIHENTGISIAENRRSMVFSRLQRRLRDTEQPTFRAYIEKVSSDPAEMQELTNRITTNETYFYRTPRVWSHLREVVIPDFISAGKVRPMKVWSAAASTGEEAHTVGAVLEDVRSKTPSFDYEVLGTDISSRVINLAIKGVYVGRPIARFRKEDPALFSAYLKGDDTRGYSVTPEIKRRLKFRVHNLVEKLRSGGPFDVVFLRNVLIYFSKADQERILANVHERLRASGTLIIGESESLNSLNCNFKTRLPFDLPSQLCSLKGHSVTVEKLHVTIGKVKVARPGQTLHAILGSCIGIGFLFREREIYGLAHCLLSKSKAEGGTGGGRHVDTAIASLSSMMMLTPPDKRKITVFLTGGANMTMPDVTDPSRLVGRINANFALKAIKEAGFRIQHDDLGGTLGRQVTIDCFDGTYSIATIPRLGG